MHMHDIGKSIRMLRETAKETQQELADALGITASHMSLLESGSRNISLDILIMIAEKYDVSLDDIVFGKKECSLNDENHGMFLRLTRKYPADEIKKALMIADCYLKIIEE